MADKVIFFLRFWTILNFFFGLFKFGNFVRILFEFYNIYYTVIQNRSALVSRLTKKI